GRGFTREAEGAGGRQRLFQGPARLALLAAGAQSAGQVVGPIRGDGVSRDGGGEGPLGRVPPAQAVVDAAERRPRFSRSRVPLDVLLPQPEGPRPASLFGLPDERQPKTGPGR